jgi:hypothetical protein
MWIGEITPCTGTPTFTLKTGELAAVNAAASVGVKTPDSATAPEAEGTHAHFAKNGATVAVGTASQPAITTPPAMYLTVPAALAVALILIGAKPNTPLPPLRISVPSVAALAGAILIDRAPITAIPATTILDLFILFSSLSIVGFNYLSFIDPLAVIEKAFVSDLPTVVV